MQNDHKANAGRVQALNNKVAEYQKLVEGAEQQGKPTGDGPTADDLEGLGDDVCARVKETSGVTLRWEIKRIGLRKGETS